MGFSSKHIVDELMGDDQAVGVPCRNSVTTLLAVAVAFTRRLPGFAYPTGAAAAPFRGTPVPRLDLRGGGGAGDGGGRRGA